MFLTFWDNLYALWFSKRRYPLTPDEAEEKLASSLFNIGLFFFALLFVLSYYMPPAISPSTLNYMFLLAVVVFSLMRIHYEAYPLISKLTLFIIFLLGFGGIYFFTPLFVPLDYYEPALFGWESEDSLIPFFLLLVFSFVLLLLYNIQTPLFFSSKTRRIELSALSLLSGETLGFLESLNGALLFFSGHVLLIFISWVLLRHSVVFFLQIYFVYFDFYAAYYLLTSVFAVTAVLISTTVMSWMAVRFPETVWFYTWNNYPRYHRRVWKLCLKVAWRQKRCKFMPSWTRFIVNPLGCYCLLYLALFFSGTWEPYFLGITKWFPFFIFSSFIYSLFGIFFYIYLVRQNLWTAACQKQLWRKYKNDTYVAADFQKKLWWIFFGSLLLFFIFLFVFFYFLYYGDTFLRLIVAIKLFISFVG